MYGISHGIYSHEEIIPECDGCEKVQERIDGIKVCGCHCFPHTKWWFGFICPQATHMDHDEVEDPIKEP